MPMMWLTLRGFAGDLMLCLFDNLKASKVLLHLLLSKGHDIWPENCPS